MKHLTSDSFRWPLPGLSGYQFESCVHSLLAEQFQNDRTEVAIIKTPRSNDGGKDIIIRTEKSISIFGICFPLITKPTTIYVECKLTSKSRLSLESFGKNLLQIHNHKVNYFLLVTNSSLTPMTYHLARAAFEREGIKFLLADGIILAQSFSLENCQPAVLTPPPALPKFDTLQVNHQCVEALGAEPQEFFEIYLQIRNHSTSSKPCRLFLRTNVNWEISDEDIHFYLDPKESRSYKLLATRKGNEGDKTLELHIDCNGQTETLTLLATAVEFAFLPKLHGEQHHSIIKNLVQLLDANSSGIISISGEAGAGKTRILDEVIDTRRNSNIHFFRFYFERSQTDKTLSQIRTQLATFADPTDHAFPEILTSNIGSDSDIVLRIWREFHRYHGVLVLIFEDLHHAETTVCKSLEPILTATRNPGFPPLILILTGRSDFTFPNQSYFALLDFFRLSTKRHIHSFEVTALSDEEAKDLIRSTISGLPPAGLDKIHSLSMNIPFNIFQCVEYLLETRIAVLLGRHTVGIPNIKNFASKVYIPKTLEELFDLRIKALVAFPRGIEARDALCVLSFFGFQLSREIFASVLESEDGNEVERLLRLHRFLHTGTTPGYLQWYHENLLRYIRRLVERTDECQKYAKYIVGTPALFLQLGVLERGKIACLAGDYLTAVQLLETVRIAIENCDNFSSENIEPRLFEYLHFLYIALQQTNATVQLLSKVILAKAYMGVHYLPLMQGIEVCREAQKQVDHLRLNNDQKENLKTSLQQLQAHALMDVGYLSKAKRSLLEIESAVRISRSLSDQHELHFDLYNRLQDLYRFHNHLRLAVTYGVLAQRAAKKYRSTKLEVVGILDSALPFHFIDTQRCIRELQKGLTLCKEHGTDLHRVTGELALISACLIDGAKETASSRGYAEDSVKLLDHCISKGYYPLIPRACLLSAATWYCYEAMTPRSDFCKSLFYIDLGIDTCVKYGVGYMTWQLYNNKALIAERLKESADTVFQLFSTAVSHLESEDLFFLGNLDFCCANLIVLSNFSSFLDRHDNETSVYGFLKKLRFYDGLDFYATEKLHSVLANLRRCGLLFHSKRLARAVIFDDQTRYGLCACA